MERPTAEEQMENAGTEPALDEEGLRRIVSEFGTVIHMPSLALDGDGRVDLLVGETPLAICLVQRPMPALWVGCEVGTIDAEDRRAVEWLLRESFVLWAFERVTLGRDEKSGMAQAFMLLQGAALGAEVLEAAVGRLVTLVQPLRARIAQQDFPPIAEDPPIDPALQTIRV